MALLAWLPVAGHAAAARSILILLTTVAVLPSVFVFMAYRAGYVKTVDVSSRTERLFPAVFAVASAALAYPLLQWIEAPSLLLALAAALIVQLAVLGLTTMWWKISYHAGAAGGLAAVAFAVEGMSLGVPLVLLACVVAWARVRLGRHTPAQVSMGLLTASPMTWWTWS